MRLNVGCGLDYREGFVNIDGSSALPRVDKVIDLSNDSLVNHFKAGSIEHILCNDFLEHHFHWEGVRILVEFFTLLGAGGSLELRVPDSEFILNCDKDVEWKLRALYGGQDAQQTSSGMDVSRESYPQFFCHKYGWTRDRISRDLTNAGFLNIGFEQAGANVVTYTSKA